MRSAGADARLRGPRAGREHSWGIRIGVGPFREVTGILRQLRSGSFDAIVARYQEKHGLNRDGSPKRSTVRSILQTMTHLGVVSIDDHTYRLSSLGAEYAGAIGTADEAARLATILLRYPAFRSIWLRLRNRGEVRHSEISAMFGREFFYAPRPAANFAAFLIGFATEAGLLRKNAGRQTYEVVAVTSAETPSSAESTPQEARRPLPKSEAKRIQPKPKLSPDAPTDLREVARELGLVLADPAWLSHADQRERLVAQLEARRSNLHGNGLARIEKVALELALQGLTRADERALRWSVQCINGLVEAGPA